MKQQKLIYVQLDTGNFEYEDTTDSGVFHCVPIEFALQDYFDKGWRIVSYQFRDIEDNEPMVVVLLEKGE